MNYLMESLSSGVEMPRIASEVKRLSASKLPQDSLLAKTAELYKDYYPVVDEATMVALLDMYKKSVDPDALPELYRTITKKFKGNYANYAKYIYEKSVFTSLDKISKAIKNNKTDFSK